MKSRTVRDSPFAAVQESARDVVDGARSRRRGSIGVIVVNESHQGAAPCKLQRSVWISPRTFQVHAIDAAEKVVVRKQLRRSQVLEFFKALPACLVGMEACATAHYWARELT
jgi:hypothetical protein